MEGGLCFSCWSGGCLVGFALSGGRVEMEEVEQDDKGVDADVAESKRVCMPMGSIPKARMVGLFSAMLSNITHLPACLVAKEFERATQ